MLVQTVGSIYMPGSSGVISEILRDHWQPALLSHKSECSSMLGQNASHSIEAHDHCQPSAP